MKLEPTLPDGWYNGQLIRPINYSSTRSIKRSDEAAINDLIEDITMLKLLSNMRKGKVTLRPSSTEPNVVHFMFSYQNKLQNKLSIIHKMQRTLGVERPLTPHCLCQPIALPVKPIVQFLLSSKKMRPKDVKTVLTRSGLPVS